MARRQRGYLLGSAVEERIADDDCSDMPFHSGPHIAVLELDVPSVSRRVLRPPISDAEILSTPVSLRPRRNPATIGV